jgi:hypothetical protein
MIFSIVYKNDTNEISRPAEDDNPFAKYNYTRRKRQSDLWIRLAKIGGVVLLCGLLFLLYESIGFRGKNIPAGSGTHKSTQHGLSHDSIVRENATLVMLVRYMTPFFTFADEKEIGS